jgi:glycosyltransferase involved in cell wall biosynthesis
MKSVVLMPAHNEETAISGVVKEVSNLGFVVVVVDDGSSDKTSETAKNAGAIVIKNQINMGKGLALRKGFEYILSNMDFDVIITMDADGQHEPSSLSDFIKKAEISESDLVLGNRMEKTEKMPRLRVFTNRFMSGVLSKKIGQYVPDTQCGYRLIKKDLLKKLDFSTSRYEMESEMLIKAGRLGARIDSVPINSIYSGQTSKINPIIDTFRFIRLMMRS